ncbi:hypothetical protein C6V83_13320 [Gordonia iterans]|uniref:Uncharacterized protein n=1 Tax=Gordonia iterans TaxID=1004901 RepID=A0A2S0KHC3_9ACTN|nr:hypothetical protein [Gordonia iterans]AVM01087.1 hypothetical protein C6V83_13320 [Gordonia iterans]
MEPFTGWMPQWHAMASLSYDELRRRAAVVEQLAVDHGCLCVAPHTVHGFEHFSWANGGGESTNWFFHPDGRILLTVFDHEEDLNVYGHDDYDLQLGFFDGVPVDLRAAVLGLPENGVFLNIESADRTRSVLTVSGVFWFDGRQWHVARGLTEYCAANEIELWSASGYVYCTGEYFFGTDLTVDTLIERQRERGYYDRSPDREERDRAGFARSLATAEARLGLGPTP